MMSVIKMGIMMLSIMLSDKITDMSDILLKEIRIKVVAKMINE